MTPAFVAIEVVTEMLVSAALIALHRERYGSARAEFDHWPAMAVNALYIRFAVVASFTLVLAAVVQLVRRWLLSREQRASMADAVARQEHGA